MNFLAHTFLSRHNNEWMIGNFIADNVKGKKYLEYTTKISEGILMHRAIDDFTDHHPDILHSKNILRPKHGLYSGVIVDIFCDHFLAKNWSDYSNEKLDDFIQNAYHVFQLYESILPERNKNILKYMIAHNWLLSYANPDGINRALSGMAKRSKYPSHMDEAINDLLKYYSDFENDFKSFFPQLEKFVVEKFKS
jgi:acyl carrier protein phosphodiesterase